MEVKREERKRRAKIEDKTLDLEQEREQMGKKRVRRLLEVWETRKNDDIDDYFHIFEMTAKAQLIPQRGSLGSLSEKLNQYI